MNGSQVKEDKDDFPMDGIVCRFCQRDITFSQSQCRVVPIPVRHSHETQDGDAIKIHLIKCCDCQKDVGVLHDGKWRSITDFLTNPEEISGIKQVETEVERQLLYVLSEVCHNQYDLDLENSSESPFLEHNVHEFAKIVWQDGRAAGFYSLKPKGSPVSCNGLATYCLPVIDTLYVSAAFRRRGIGTKLIRDVVKQFPDENIGFSSPVSKSLLVVLYKLLVREVDLRDRLWECEYDGGEGYRRNIWLHIRSVFSKRKREKEDE